MTAFSNSYPWPSSYGHYEFFEQRIRAHNKVLRLQNRGDGLYTITTSNGSELNVFVCECYSYGVAEYVETVGRLGSVDVVVVNSVWCGYTKDAKERCRDGKVGLFKIGEFMGALNQSDYWNYIIPEEKESLAKRAF